MSNFIIIGYLERSDVPLMTIPADTWGEAYETVDKVKPRLEEGRIELYALVEEFQRVEKWVRRGGVC